MKRLERQVAKVSKSLDTILIWIYVARLEVVLDACLCKVFLQKAQISNVPSVERPSTIESAQFCGLRKRIASIIEPINRGST